MNKQKQPYYYFILCFISLYGAAGILDILDISRYCSIIVRLWSLYHLYLIISHGYFKGPIKYFSIFVFTLIAYSVMPTIHGVTYQVGRSTLTASNYLNSTWMIACPVYSFYWFTKNNLINRTFIRRMTLLGAVYCISMFVFINSRFAATLGNFGNANNSSYIFLQLIPLLVYLGYRKKEQSMLLLLVFVAIVLSAKRGAMLIALVCFFIFYIKSVNLSKRKERSKAVFLAFLAFIIYGAFIYYEYINNAYFNERFFSLVENDSSGRQDYYETLWLTYSEYFNVSDKIFGKGLYGTIPIIGNYAHNDWLEYLICFGLLGCSIYLVYFISLIIFYRKHKIANNEQSYSLLITIVILFMSTIFSMSYTGMTVFICFSLGYSICYLEDNSYKMRLRNLR